MHGSMVGKNVTVWYLLSRGYVLYALDLCVKRRRIAAHPRDFLMYHLETPLWGIQDCVVYQLMDITEPFMPEKVRQYLCLSILMAAEWKTHCAAHRSSGSGASYYAGKLCGILPRCFRPVRPSRGRRPGVAMPLAYKSLSYCLFT